MSRHGGYIEIRRCAQRTGRPPSLLAFQRPISRGGLPARSFGFVDTCLSVGPARIRSFGGTTMYSWGVADSEQLAMLKRVFEEYCEAERIWTKRSGKTLRLGSCGFRGRGRDCRSTARCPSSVAKKGKLANTGKPPIGRFHRVAGFIPAVRRHRRCCPAGCRAWRSAPISSGRRRDRSADRTCAGGLVDADQISYHKANIPDVHGEFMQSEFIRFGNT